MHQQFKTWFRLFSGFRTGTKEGEKERERIFSEYFPLAQHAAANLFVRDKFMKIASSLCCLSSRTGLSSQRSGDPVDTDTQHCQACLTCRVCFGFQTKFMKISVVGNFCVKTAVRQGGAKSEFNLKSWLQESRSSPQSGFILLHPGFRKNILFSCFVCKAGCDWVNL